MEVRRPGRRTAIAASLLAAAVTAALIFAGRGWIADRYYLWRLDHAAPEEQKKWMDLLVDRKCADVVPMLLSGRTETPFIGLAAIWDLGLQDDRVVSLGPGAVPHLARALDAGSPDPSVVLGALRRFGPDATTAVPALIRYLKSPGATDRMKAFGVLEAIGEGADPAIPVLLEALTSEKGMVLIAAAGALERISPGRPEVVPALIAALADENQYALDAVAKCIAELGPRAKEAAGALEELLESDTDIKVVEAAAKALDALDPGRGLEGCLDRARNGMEKERILAVAALGGFRSKAGRIVPVLVAMTADPDDDVARAAIEALGEIGVASPEVLGAFSARLAIRDGSASVPLALKRLCETSGEPGKVVGMLVAALDREGGTRTGAMEALEWVGPPAAGAAPALEAIASGSDRDAARHAGRALSRIRQEEK